MPSIDIKVKPDEWRALWAAVQPRYLERACVRAPGPSRGIDPNRLSTDPVFRSVESYVVHDATLSRAIETYIGETAVVVKDQHIWCSFAKSVFSAWQENAFFCICRCESFVVLILLSLQNRTLLMWSLSRLWQKCS